MEAEPSDHRTQTQTVSASVSVPTSSSPSSSSLPIVDDSSLPIVDDLSPSWPPLQVHEEERGEVSAQRRRRPRRLHNPPPSRFSYRLNLNISGGSGSPERRDDAWSCLVVLITFWFFASMTLILGFYGSVNLQLGPNCSRLLQANPLFVNSLKAQKVDDPEPGPMLYGFYGDQPSLGVYANWSETHNVSIVPSFHKEWIYFLNSGSEVDISYSVESPSSSPLSLVISKGRESLVQWIEDPSYPNSTLSWNIVQGSGRVQQKIWDSTDYYIAVGNLNLEGVQVQLNFTMKAFQYDTAQANYKCSLSQQQCVVKLFLLTKNAAVLTTPGPEQSAQDGDWQVMLSYGPRWITYFVGSGVMTVLIILAFKICNIFQNSNGNGTEVRSEQAPLLPHKDDDLSSWGSSDDSSSLDEGDLEGSSLAVASGEGKPQNEGENSKNPHRVCAICFDGPRDCFFLPCGHCATCFTCGTRIAEEAGSCPICRKKLKKVRKIFSV